MNVRFAPAHCLWYSSDNVPLLSLRSQERGNVDISAFQLLTLQPLEPEKKLSFSGRYLRYWGRACELCAARSIVRPEGLLRPAIAAVSSPIGTPQKWAAPATLRNAKSNVKITLLAAKIFVWVALAAAGVIERLCRASRAGGSIPRRRVERLVPACAGRAAAAPAAEGAPWTRGGRDAAAETGPRPFRGGTGRARPPARRPRSGPAPARPAAPPGRARWGARRAPSAARGSAVAACRRRELWQAARAARRAARQRRRAGAPRTFLPVACGAARGERAAGGGRGGGCGPGPALPGACEGGGGGSGSGMAAAGGGSCGPGAAACGGGAAGSVSAAGGGVSMFRWLEVLEKEFDKAFVDVDLLLGEIDPDQADITYEGRQKMTSLSSCFAQLCHKAQTVSQINHKLEVRGTGGAEGAPESLSSEVRAVGGLLPPGSWGFGGASPPRPVSPRPAGRWWSGWRGPALPSPWWQWEPFLYPGGWKQPGSVNLATRSDPWDSSLALPVLWFWLLQRGTWSGACQKSSFHVKSSSLEQQMPLTGLLFALNPKWIWKAV